MKAKTWIILFVVLLCWSVSATASRVSSSSSYGLPAGAECSGALVCTVTISSDSLTQDSDITDEIFQATAYGGTTFDPVSTSPFVVFDFTVGNVMLGDSLVLTASGAPIAADSNGSLGWGVFDCGAGSGAACGPDPADPATYCASGCISGSTVTLPLFGTAPVFFVILDTTNLDPTLNVTATIEGPSTGAVPEPRLWPLAAIAILAGVFFYRRRLAATAR